MQPPSLVVHRSNRLERSVDALCSVLQEPLADPLAKEWIVVQGRGMALWLNMRLSERLGIWANVDYIYPRQLVQRALTSAFGAEPANEALSQYRREQLRWVIMAELAGLRARATFADIDRYLGEDADGARQYELCEQISQAFDEYLTYRPHWLRQWQKTEIDKNQLDLFSQTPIPKNEAWQRELWLRLVSVLGEHHVAHLEDRFHKALRRKRPSADIPERVSVFGLSGLPPSYVRVLSSLGTAAQVHLFTLSPSREFFADVRRSRVEQPALIGDAGNPLLQAYGVLGAEFATVLDEETARVGCHILDQEDYEPAPDTLLGRLQNDILAHRDSGCAESIVEENLSGRLPPDDPSLVLHSCHGSTREVEVLHDQILALIDEGFAPNDILVMMPNVDEYAPLIEAVFERPADDPRRVSYRISDRRPQGDNSVLEAFSRLLMLADSRIAASEVLDLLALPKVHERFEITPSDLPTIARWVVDSGIRWGVDAAHKQRAGVEPEHQNSWRFGLDRLLLGYALGDGNGQACHDILPYPEIEGSGAGLLGRFVDFCETLFSSVERLRQPRSPTDWQQTLSETLAALMAQGTEDSWQHQQVLDALADLVESTRLAGFEAELSLRVVRRWLDSHTDDTRQARGFLSGGVTFCAMVPMRSIPFPVVYLLGMNDGTFPRSTHRPDFNLIDHGSEGRRPGDPDRRIDDRYLFLEALLSARQRLILSYVGQSIRDNTRLAPSIVVTELLDYLQRCYPSTEPSVASQLTIRHPLQPFSPRYFRRQEPRLFSYEHSYLEGARLMSQPRREMRPLFDALLPQPADVGDVSLDQWLEFWASPITYLLRRRLAVQLSGEHLDVPDREPVEVLGLDAYLVGAPMLEQRLAGASVQATIATARASGWIPSGAPGQLALERMLRSVEPIVAAVRRVRGDPSSVPHPFRIALTDAALHGELSDVHDGGRVSHRFSRLSATQRLRCWVTHLVYCAVASPEKPRQSWLVARAESGEGAAQVRFGPVENPLALLEDLMQLYQLGQRQPLPFFAQASMTFVRELRSPKGDVDRALAAAETAWLQVDRRYSPALARLYPDDAQLTEEGPVWPGAPAPSLDAAATPNFRQMAERVFGPLLSHSEEA